MDFSKYKKVGNYGGDKWVKRCLFCGKDLENDGTYLYLQSFCSAHCKQKYIDEGSPMYNR